MKNLPEHVERSIRERKLIRPRGKVLVAVSGGLDSMVLLHVLHELACRFNWQICVAHFNHRLRGQASDADERVVKKAATQLGLPIRVGRGSVKDVAKRKRVSIEMAARELRHRFLAQTARRMKCPVVALAHHADDQVELFLLRLLRGAGGDGLAGMKWCSVSPADPRVQIVRPLLGTTKAALMQFARGRQIRHREDASNTSRDILRNRVRHELLPLLRKHFQPTVDQAILRLMDIVGADSEIASEAARAWLKLKPTARRIAEQAIGLQRRVIQIQLQKQNIKTDFDLIELLRCSRGKPVTVTPDLWIRCDEAGRISPVKVAGKRFCPQCIEGQLDGSTGSLDFSGVKISWVKAASRGSVPGVRASRREVFDADQVGSRIILRHWQAGDRFQPIGMATAVKLQDWFTNRKISSEQRRKLIVATTAHGEIFWIEGERIGEQFKLTPATRRRLIWRWK